MDKAQREIRPEDVDLGKGSHEQQQGGRKPDRDKDKPLFRRPETPPPAD